MNSTRLHGKTDYLPANGLKGHVMSPLISGKQWIGRAHYYAPNSLLTHPLVSPLFEADLRGLPPLMIQLGGGELLRDEGILFALKASGNYQAMNLVPKTVNHQENQATPTPVILEIYGEMPHVFHVFSFTIVSKIAFDRCADFIRKVIQKKNDSCLPDSHSKYVSEKFIDYHGNIKSIEKTEVADDGKTILITYLRSSIKCWSALNEGFSSADLSDKNKVYTLHGVTGQDKYSLLIMKEPINYRRGRFT